MGNKNKKKRNKQPKHDNNEKEEYSETQDLLTDDSNKETSINTNRLQSDLKRQHSENDSDTQDSPKKVKKRKKQLVPSETSGKKTKSIRQMKREKFAKRQAEAEEAAKDQLKSECLNYLSQWKHNRQDWKFMKVKQLWLFKNKFSNQRIPDESWPILLEYFESAKGNIRKMLLDDAHKIINQMDEWTEQAKEKESNENDENEDSQIQKPDESAYRRARSLIQCLQE